MSNLLPPSANTLQRAIAKSTKRISALPVDLRDLYDADKCPIEFLPWLAWHVGIVSWKNYWSEQTKRAVVKSAVDIARRRGTAGAVRDVVAAFGANIALREWWEKTPRGTPGTFDLVMTIAARDGSVATAELIDDIIGEINRVKPVRAHYTLTIGFQMLGTQKIVGAIRPALYQRLKFGDN